MSGDGFVANTPDRLWCTDITEHPAGDGKVYAAVVLDVFSRTVVGWSIADHMHADHLRAELVVDALQRARWRRRPTAGAKVHPTAAPNTRPGSSVTGCGKPGSSTR